MASTGVCCEDYCCTICAKQAIRPNDTLKDYFLCQRVQSTQHIVEDCKHLPGIYRASDRLYNIRLGPFF